MKTYDVIVLGSGSTGSMLGSILARNGASVLIIDGRSHPKLSAEGESVTPRAAVALRALSERYHVPEIKTLTTFNNCSRIVNTSFGVRKHYGILLHKRGRPQDPRELNQLVIHSEQDAAHLFRPDTDTYLFNTAIKYGCATRQNYPITRLEIDDNKVTVGGADGSAYESRCVVDTTGRQSPLAAAFDLREDIPRFTHRSRSQWTHMINVRPADEVFTAGRAAHKPPVPWHQGTVYHVFEGGYVWVIPFDNHPRSISGLCSVGISLDPRRHPKDPSVSPDEEFAELTARFPDLARQFDQAVPLREWECTDCVPYSSTRVVGNRWLLIGNAAGYVDPLFSRDLSDTAEVIHVLAWRLLRAVKDDDFSAERFSYVERLQQALLDSTDDLVSSAFISFSDYALWNAVFRIWACDLLASTSRLSNAMTAFLADRVDDHFTALEDVRYPRLLWPDHDGFKKLFGEMVTQCQAFDGGLISGGQAAAELFRAIEEARFISDNLAFTEPSARFIHSRPQTIARALGAGPARTVQQLTRLLPGNVRHVITARGQKRPVA